MKIAIASGKGGTGKTTVAVNLALSLKKDIDLFDCDVEEPNSNIFLNLETEEIEEMRLKIPEINEDVCTHCGKCAELCEFNALAVLKEEVLVFQELCHACGLCSIGCPVEAISEKSRRIGVIEKGEGVFNGKEIEFYQGVLDIGEALSTPLIKGLKKYSKDEENKIDLFDVPPGTGCPVIESLSGMDFVVLVTEPTPFGLHDLKLSVEVIKKMHIPFGVIINMVGTRFQGVEEYCKKENIPVLLKIPQSRKIAELYSNGIPFVKEMDGWEDEFLHVFSEIIEIYEKSNQGVTR